MEKYMNDFFFKHAYPNNICHWEWWNLLSKYNSQRWRYVSHTHTHTCKVLLLLKQTYPDISFSRLLSGNGSSKKESSSFSLGVLGLVDVRGLFSLMSGKFPGLLCRQQNIAFTNITINTTDKLMFWAQWTVPFQQIPANKGAISQLEIY